MDKTLVKGKESTWNPQRPRQGPESRGNPRLHVTKDKRKGWHEILNVGAGVLLVQYVSNSG